MHVAARFLLWEISVFPQSMVLAVVAFGLVGAGVAGRGHSVAAASEAAKPCRGGVSAVIRGVRQCLQPGRRCNPRLEREYQKYGFHCRSGRLSRISKAAKPPKFAAPTDLRLNSSGFDGGPNVSNDGLSLFFISDRPRGESGDIWLATRRDPSEPFGTPIDLGAGVNGAGDEGAPSISSDGLSLYFDSDPSRPGGQGGGDIWLTTRQSTAAPFETPVNLGPPVDSVFDEGHPDISSDGLSLYFSSDRPGPCGGTDIWVATRKAPTQPFQRPAKLPAPVNTCADEEGPSISDNGLTLFFSSTRAGGSGRSDLWIARRKSVSAAFDRAANLGPTVNSSFDDQTPDIARDGTLYFTSNRPGGVGFYDLWESRPLPSAWRLLARRVPRQVPRRARRRS
jgi:Tol biopolymer transport system component